jgi:aromatic ring hydroxylase
MPAALRTGADYLTALRDGREVYLEGRRVADVTTEPGLRAVAETFARMYDLAHVDAFRDTLTFVDDQGRRVSGAWIEPRTRQQLEWRRLLTQTIARHTGGLFGRQPDYVALFHLGMLDIRRDFSQGDDRFAENIARYWEYARDHDLALAHAFIDPQFDPSVPLDETTLLRVVDRNAEGVVVRGVKSVATFAVHADECLVGAFPRPGIADHHVVYFSVPIALPGLRVVARTPHAAGSAFDHPASQYGDENDAMLIFDDVLVPWDRVFSLSNPAFCFQVFPRITEWAHWSILARLAVKAEVLVGLYTLIPEMLGRARTPAAQEALGEVVRYLTTLRAFIHASEDQGQPSTGGYWMPDPVLVTAGRAYSVEHYRRIVGYLQDIGSQALVNMPTEATFASETIGPTLRETFTSPAATAEERARIVRLGLDMVADSYGGRQTLFELFNALPWTAQRDQLLSRFDTTPYKQLARATAGLDSLGEAATAAAQAAGATRPDYDSVGRVYATHQTRASAPPPSAPTDRDSAAS